jgi:hypothetical protein
MGAIKVHEFIALDGVFEDPSWTFEFGFDPRMGEALGAIMGTCRALLLGRKTFEMFTPAWSTRTAADDPGASAAAAPWSAPCSPMASSTSSTSSPTR